jgi:NAD(P)-dependent dehydrogenase (short-subunit alcohol dehydrogenase family)
MIVITGATSNTGRAVAARLLDEGRTVRVGGRSVARLRGSSSERAMPTTSSPTSGSAVAERSSREASGRQTLAARLVGNGRRYPGRLQRVICAQRTQATENMSNNTLIKTTRRKPI